MKKTFVIYGLLGVALLTSGCSKLEVFKKEDNFSLTVAPTPVPEPIEKQDVEIVAGNGDGSGGLTVPTGDAVVARIKNGLQGLVNPASGNFGASLAILRKNLPKATDPMKATGYDQIQLVAYAACSDLTGGSNPAMKSVYGVDPAMSLTASKPALIAAGQKMLDRYVAGLASSGNYATGAAGVFSSLVDTNKTNGDSTTISFMSVCIAANTAGSTLMSF